MRLLRQAGAVLALLLVASSVSFAQARGAARNNSSGAKPIELGTDAMLQIGLDDAGFTRFTLPAGLFRVGIHISDVISIEPFTAISYFKPEGGDGSTQWLFGAGGLYHFSADRTKSQFYVRPFLSLDGITDGDSEFTVGVGGGMKFKPMMNGRMQWRTEVNVASRNDSNTLSALFGISVWPR
jgi:hypothetical protein